MVDIRIPIGLMFSLLGIIISILGFTTFNSAIYQRSLGININIIMGILMLIFGLVMLYFARRKKKV